MKILFLISEREITLTGGRFLQLLYRLKDHEITICSNSEQVLNHVDPTLNFNKILLKPQEYAWSMQQRDKFAKKFINTFHNIKLCDDMPMWKAEAFDDYLWNVSQFVFPQVEGKYDLAIIPIPSRDESPGHFIDEFFTVQLFKLKNDKTPILGLELLPIQFVPVLFPKIVDYFVVKNETSKQFLQENYSISSDRINVMNYKSDNYALSSIEDVYNHYLFKKVQPPRDELNIVLMNHVQMREELKQTVKVLSQLSVKVNLIFCLINYAVKELHEMDVFRDLLLPDFSKYFTRIEMVDIMDLPQLLISMDAFISMNYMTIFNWARDYNIPCIIYNNSEQLKNELETIWSVKKQQLGLCDIINKVKINEECLKLAEEDLKEGYDKTEIYGQGEHY